MLAIALAAIFIYLIFIKWHALIVASFQVFAISIEMDNMIPFILLHLMAGSFALGILWLIYNQFLVNRIPGKHKILFLLVVSLLLSAAVLALTQYQGLIMQQTENFLSTYQQQIQLSKILQTAVAYLGLGFFLWRFLSRKPHVAW